MNKLLLPLLLLISMCSKPEVQPVLEKVGEINIIPKPQTIDRPRGGQFALTRDTVIVAADEQALKVASALNDMLTGSYGITLPIVGAGEPKGAILFSTNPQDETEKYTLRIEPDSVRISGSERGMFYGAQSLFQLLPVAGSETLLIPAAEITDGPRFRYRGAHLDVSRHFMGPEDVKKYILLMSRYKLNYFHWHLSDDQGWRIEIKKHPQLTEAGSTRPETVIDKNYQPYRGDGSPVGGFYTQDQIREVATYAKAHYVTIVPEIDMPAHSSSALAAYPQYGCKGSGYPYKVQTKWTEPPDGFPDVLCPTEETISFLSDVLGEVIDLFPDSPYIHIGGDETNLVQWTGSPAVRSLKAQFGLADNRAVLRWFVSRMAAFVRSRGRRPICWDDVVDPGHTTDATIMFWDTRNKKPQMAAAGHEVIMTPYDNTYFDHPQGPGEPLAQGDEVTLREVYMFDPVPAGMRPAEARNIIGGQGCVWTEFIKTYDRVEYMAYPRMLALAEVLWSRLDPPEAREPKPAASTMPLPGATPVRTPTPIRVSGPQKIRDFDDFTRRLSGEFLRLDREKVNYRLPEPYGKIVPLPRGKLELHLTSPVPGGKIYYTANGLNPDESSLVYYSPAPLNTEPGRLLEVRAIVVTPDGRKSSVGRYLFTQ